MVLNRFEDPHGEDFRNAFACLKTKTDLVKKYLLDILNPIDLIEGYPDDQVDKDPNIRDAITLALSELYLPGLATLVIY